MLLVVKNWTKNLDETFNFLFDYSFKFHFGPTEKQDWINHVIAPLALINKKEEKELVIFY